MEEEFDAELEISKIEAKTLLVIFGISKILSIITLTLIFLLSLFINYWIFILVLPFLAFYFAAEFGSSFKGILEILIANK